MSDKLAQGDDEIRDAQIVLLVDVGRLIDSAEDVRRKRDHLLNLLKQRSSEADTADDQEVASHD